MWLLTPLRVVGLIASAGLLISLRDYSKVDPCLQAYLQFGD